MAYSHVQKSPLDWLLASAAAGLALGAWALRAEVGPALAAGAMAAAAAFLAGSLAWLKVQDGGDALRVRYGPIPVLGTRIPYATIKGAEAGRTAIIDGWGIHWVPWRGWTYNLWGRSCVAIRTDRGVVRVGTDDPDGLARFLRGRAGLEVAQPQARAEQRGAIAGFVKRLMRKSPVS
jgi:hypothetical protein